MNLLDIIIVTIIFTTFANRAFSVDRSFERSEPQTCGHGPNISYPFWLSGNQDSFCGYPSFKITCNGRFPVLSISSEEYIVKEIFYSNHSFVLANAAAVYGEKCPLFSLERTPFKYSSNHVKFSFFYGCNEEHLEYMFPYPIDCASNSSHHSFAIFHMEVVERMSYSLDSCQSSVHLPFDDAVNVDALTQMNCTEILKMGFILNWTAQNCSNCQRSGGRCGFDNNEFVCFCSNRSHVKTCDDDNSWNWTRKVIVGVCTAATTVAIMCAIFFVYQRRNRKPYVPSSFVTRSILSSTYSMDDDMEKGSTYLGVHIFSYKELEEATNYFDSAKELGDGGFGTVYHGNVHDGRAVAVKRLYENNWKRVEQFMNEIEILARLRHQNLVLLYGCTSRQSRELLLVYEYVPNGTLAEHLHGGTAKPGALPWLTRINIAIETASALSYLHASDIIHRDVKTTNILLDNNFGVKVADFGLSRLFPVNVTHISTAPQGTPGYVDPEYNQCYQLTSKSDVYSFGVVLIELISSMPAVDITRHRHEINLSTMAINKIKNHTLHDLVDPYLGFESDSRTRKMIIAVAELAFRCLQTDKDVRPSMVEVLNELKRIQSNDFNIQKTKEIDISADDNVPLKCDPLPPSPDSVASNWTSASKSPNGSGKLFGSPP